MKRKSKLDRALTRFTNFDMVDFMSGYEGYDIKSASSFKDDLRKVCEDAGLIYIAKKRWAGEEFTKEHEDSDTVVDRLIALIVHEKIQLEKENYEKNRNKRRRI
ncbi:MAG: hypothetical protein CL489_17940 [Acidobacteria bacterium]|nr:hypothetical protein [Acidobacteriota bacterium]|tara:strand:- start:579 stop:890 length:312 start_codon:yes stop_codon:yes gene_type:complete